jgi:hypothetical protein
MRRTGCTLGRAFSLACFFALLLAAPAYADFAVVAADFDGDGHGDHVIVTNEQPTVLRVWLSSTRATEILRSAEPVLRIAAADLDGDNHAELIATGGSPFLKIWTKVHDRFRSFRPHQPPTSRNASRTTGSASASSRAPESPTNCATRAADGSLASTLSPGTPASYEWQHAPRARSTTTSPLSFTIFAPRPPPASPAA